jgi:putative spermidine/putrescine transport system permease protein
MLGVEAVAADPGGEDTRVVSPRVPRSASARGVVRALRDATLLVPFAALIVAIYAGPTLFFFRYALDAPAWGRTLAEPGMVATIARTLVIAVEVTLICAGLGYIYAVALVRAGSLLRTALLVALVVPFLTGDLIRTYAWIVALGKFGPINEVITAVLGEGARPSLLYSRAGTLIGMVNVLLPVFVLPTYAVLSQVSPQLNRASRTLGASAVEAFLRVDFPLSLPGAAAGAVLVFISSLGFFVTPSLLGGASDAMIAQRIDVEVSRSLSLSGAAVLALILAGVVFGCLLLFRLLYPVEQLFVQRSLSPRPRRDDRRNHSTAAAEGWWAASVTVVVRARLRATRYLSAVGWSRLALVCGVLLAAFSVLPLLIVVPVSLTGEDYLHFPPSTYSLRWYEAVLGDELWRQALLNSVVVGILATIIAAAVGLPLAFALVRSHIPGRVKAALIGLMALPAVTPVIVFAIGVYVWYLRWHLTGDRLALAAAHAVLGLPYLAMIVMAGLRDFDIRFERAARSLGAGMVQTWRRITLPLLARSLVAGLFFAFLQSFNEFLVARAVTTLDTTTLPIKLWNGAREEISPALGAVATISLVATFAAAIAFFLARRGSRAVTGGR